MAINSLLLKQDYFFRKCCAFQEELNQYTVILDRKYLLSWNIREAEGHSKFAREGHDGPPFAKRKLICQSKHPYFAPNANAV